VQKNNACEHQICAVLASQLEIWMTDEFRVLTVAAEETTVRATTSCDSLADTKVQELLFQEFDRLAALGAKPVILDLRSLKFFEGTVPGKLLRLSEALNAAGGSLTVLAAANICEVLQMLQLDKKFSVNESETPAVRFKLG